MLGHFGFSYVGLIYLLLLFIPNLIWRKHPPVDYDHTRENKLLLWFERAGQVCCVFSVLFFRDYRVTPLSAWSAWLFASFALMILYECCWIRYFASQHTEAAFYRSFSGIPVPLASLPVLAFLLLGIYGKVVWLMASAIVIGIGHIGIHLQHLKGIAKS